MRKKKLVLQCSCHFTRMGLEALINESDLSASLELVASARDATQCESLLTDLPVVDIVILILRNSDYNLASLLELIGERLPHRHPSSQVVLMGNLGSLNVLKRCFSGLENVWSITASSAPSATLLKNLQEIAADDKGKARDPRAGLSRHERLVLRKLLGGESPNQIANGLAIHYKMVSYYKRSALTKLGMSSLSPLVVNRHNAAPAQNMTMMGLWKKLATAIKKPTPQKCEVG